MNRFICIAIMLLLLIFANSGFCEEKGLNGTVRKMSFQSKLYEMADTNKFALTVPQEVAYMVTNKGGLTWKEVEHMMTKMNFNHVETRGIAFELEGVFFDENIQQWILLFKPIKWS